MKEGISVIICCYNSVNKLGETLLYLSRQKCNFPWEILVVDNASTDDTKEFAKNELKKYGSEISYKVITENEPGKQYAIKKGLSSSKYEYIVICDDDNWLDENYLQIVCQIFEHNSEIGAIGGLGIPKPEIDPPIWFQNFIHGYAAFPQSTESGFLNGVYGAGMAFRKSIFNKIYGLGYNSILTCRKGDSLSSGGDTEMCFQIILSGFKIWYDDRLKFQHFIPKGRLTWDYLRKLHVGLAKSYVLLNLYEKAISTKNDKLSPFYWAKKAFYYLGIYIKYFPKHYKTYKRGIGSTEEIRHITWRTIGFDYLKYNFSTIRYYKEIIALKNHLNEKQ